MKAGTVRISDPRLPHGSTGPATKQRRTMLPWYVRVSEDGSTMENPKMGTYDEIATAYQRLSAAPRSPSGFPNMFGGIQWAFPGDSRPVLQNAVARAIICQEPWDSAQVEHDLHCLLGPHAFLQQDWMRIVDDHRKDVTQWAIRAWETCKEAEKRAFGPDTSEQWENPLPDRSYFSNSGNYQGPVAYETSFTPEDAVQALYTQWGQADEETTG